MSIRIDSGDVAVAHLLEGKCYFSTAACKIQNVILLAQKWIVGAQFLLDQSFNIVSMRVDVLISILDIVFIYSYLRIYLSKTSLHRYYYKECREPISLKIISLHAWSLNQQVIAGYSGITLMILIIIISIVQNQVKMSNDKKGGMQFFKKFADKGGSLFGGMKIKGPKETKNVAQTQTSFAFNEKSNEEIKTPTSITRDDIAVKTEKRQSNRTVEVEAKTEDLNVKKPNAKVSQAIAAAKKVEVVEAEIKKVEEVPKEVKEAKEVKEEVKSQIIQTKSTEVIQRAQVAEQKKLQKTFSLPSERKKSQKIVLKAQSAVRKPSAIAKQQKKREQQKPKKSDKEQVLDQINDYTLKLAQSVISQKNIQARICQIRQEIAEQRENISNWSAEQSQCAENEEYEEADRLQTKIEEAQNIIDELAIEMSFSEDQLTKQESEELNILKTQNGSMKKIGRKLKLIQLQLQDDADVIKREETEKIQTLRNRQENERKKIQRIKKDIAYQSSQITDFQINFKQQLNEKLNPLQEDETKLKSEKSTLQSEIRQLQRKLKEKNSQLDETKRKLKSVTDNIQQMNESYKEENGKLQEWKNKLEIMENEHDEKKLELDDLQDQIEVESRVMDEKIIQKLGEAAEMTDIAKSIEQKQIHFDGDVETRRVAYDLFVQNGNSLKEFEQKHREEKEKVKEIYYRKNNIIAQIEKLEQKRELVRKIIPTLEMDQKRFADQKNFKAAGLKKAEIKQMSEKLALVKEKIEACIIQEHSLTIEEQKMNNSQKESLEEEEELRKNLAASQYRYSELKIERIIEYRDSITKNSGFNGKDKQKVLRELTDVISKLTEELSYLNDLYHLQKSKPTEVEEEEAELIEKVASDNDIELDEEDPQNRLVDNNESNYQDLANQQLDQERIEEQDTGYVPLQLD